MCLNCVRTQVDITQFVSQTGSVNQCRGCLRWLGPPWMEVEWESRELMMILLKKVHGLQRVKLVDASFVYTESHSKRVKLRLVVQKEVMHGAILQQSMIVTFVVKNKQCDDCCAMYTNGVWKSVVQGFVYAYISY